MNTNQQNKLMRLSTYMTVTCVSFIVCAKIYGWFATNSVTMLASLVDSVLDTCFSVMNLLAVHFAVRPPDHEHRFGHGKAEVIAVFVQSAFFGFSGIFLILDAIKNIFEPKVDISNASIIGIKILIFSIVITGIMVIFQKYIIKRTHSHVLEADSLHYLTDFLTNISAIVGMYITAKYNLAIFDSITAIGIAIYIIYNSVKMFKRSFNSLMDRELDEPQRKQIIELIKSNNQIIGFHDLKTRYAGAKIFIQLHLEFHHDISLKEAHRIETDIEKSILEKFPNAELIIHLDPEGIDDKIEYKD